MFWIIVVVVICSILASIFNSALGKFVIGASVVAIGFLLLKWITGLAFFAIPAKICTAVIVVVIVGTIVLALIGKQGEE